MARIAVDHSDFSVFTSDNPRTEDPEKILDEMVAGLDSDQRWQRMVDRKEAIHAALERAEPGDTVLIAGKGHEAYQIVGDVKRPFDDREVARDWLTLRFKNS